MWRETIRQKKETQLEGETLWKSRAERENLSKFLRKRRETEAEREREREGEKKCKKTNREKESVNRRTEREKKKRERERERVSQKKGQLKLKRPLMVWPLRPQKSPINISEAEICWETKWFKIHFGNKRTLSVAANQIVFQIITFSTILCF